MLGLETYGTELEYREERLKNMRDTVRIAGAAETS